jgi:hypothetical protein
MYLLAFGVVPRDNFNLLIELYKMRIELVYLGVVGTRALLNHLARSLVDESKR